MSALVCDSAIVLRCIRFGETSLIMTVFTGQYGKLSLMFKGARKVVKNGTALALEPGYEVEVVWAYKASRELQLVRELTLLDAHYPIRASLESSIIASAQVELLLRSMTIEDPHRDLFAAARHVLCTCEHDTPSRWPVFWKSYLVLLERLGFALSGAELTARAGTRLSPEAQAILRRLLLVDFAVAARLRVSLQAEREVTKFLSEYLSEHLHAPAFPRATDALRWLRRQM